jgi:hypothetical protein
MEDTDRKKKEFWSDFIYAQLLDVIRVELEKVYKDQDQLGDAYDYLHKYDSAPSKEPPDKDMTPKRRGRITDTKSTINAAINAAKEFAKDFANFSSQDNFARFSGVYAGENGRVSLRYGEFEGFEKAVDARLAELLPDIFPEENTSWPGALSVQQTLSLYTHLCLRIHSEMPDEDHRKVLEAAAKMVVVPALAFAVYQAGMAGEPQPYAVECLEAIAVGKEQLPMPRTFSTSGNGGAKPDPRRKGDSKRVRVARQCVEDHSWQRLLVALRGRSVALGETFVRESAVECLRMLKDHESHPHGSDLWKSLSRLSSTTPGANDLLVFEALSRMGHSKPTQEMKARLHCSRTRYEAIASGYYDSEFREMLGRDVATIADHIAMRSSGWGTTEKLAKAFLLSRRCLIPSDSTRDAKLDDQVKMAGMVDGLLSSCRSGNPDPSVNLLVNRYLAGFLTNPRFVKPSSRNLASIDKSVKDYAALTKDCGHSPDTAIVSLFEGRLAWFRMLAGDATLSKEVFKKYAAALKTLFGRESRKEMIDSEVPVWLLPEVITLISLGDHLTASEDYGLSFTKQLKPPAANINFAYVMQKVGERHYGIYFNMHAELRRICLGAVRASKTGK